MIVVTAFMPIIRERQNRNCFGKIIIITTNPMSSRSQSIANQKPKQIYSDFHGFFRHQHSTLQNNVKHDQNNPQCLILNAAHATITSQMLKMAIKRKRCNGPIMNCECLTTEESVACFFFLLLLLFLSLSSQCCCGKSIFKVKISIKFNLVDRRQLVGVRFQFHLDGADLVTSFIHSFIYAVHVECGLDRINQTGVCCLNVCSMFMCMLWTVKTIDCFRKSVLIISEIWCSYRVLWR